MSKDGRVWEFVLRKNARFHNGDPVTGDDVKFSFERYRGAAAAVLKERVREVQVVDPGRVRFHLKDPWPDFMTFYGTSASGAAWIVPKKYFEKVGEDGFRRAPTACSSSCSPISGRPARRGRTGGSGWPRASPSTARPSTRRSRSATRDLQAMSCLATRSSPSPFRRIPTIPGARGPSSPRRA